MLHIFVYEEYLRVEQKKKKEKSQQELKMFFEPQILVKCLYDE